MKINISIQPSGRRFIADSDKKLLEILQEAGIHIPTSCGGKGTCGKCKVKVAGSLQKPCADEIQGIPAEELLAGYRLACKTTVCGDIIVEVAETTKGKILEEGDLPEVDVDPGIYKLSFWVPPPSDFDKDDFGRLSSSLKNKHPRHTPISEPSLQLLQDLPNVVRLHDGLVTAVMEGSNIVALEPGDTASHIYGVAVDVGTTTMVGYLWNLAGSNGSTNRFFKKAPICTASCYNPQSVRGDDIMTRITYASENKHNLVELQTLAINGIESLIRDLARSASIDAKRIYSIVLVGNTVMNHLLLGIVPKFLGVAPYVSAFNGALSVKARDLCITSNPNAIIHILPNLGGFIGSDTLAGMVASQIPRHNGVYLLIDLGTNGEIVLCKGKQVICCSTAAGPAFEGARINMGMRAMEGAVNRVFLDENTDIAYETIRNSKPRGICGSGLVDALAVMSKLGLITPSGRIATRENVSQKYEHLIKQDSLGRSLVIVPPECSNENTAIKISQKDIREIQLAKGAISAGIGILMKRLCLSESDIDGLFLAGAFGNYINPASAQLIGLIPQIDNQKIFPMGNAAGVGAQMALLSRTTRRKFEDLTATSQVIDLALDPQFSKAFVSSMSISPQLQHNMYD